MVDFDSHPTHLISGTFRIPLIPSPSGPRLDLDGTEYECLDWILHYATVSEEDGGEVELFAATQTGAAYFHQIMFIREVDPDDDLDEAKEAWRRTTASELEGELRYVCVASDSCIIPLDVLGDVTRQLKELRKVYVIDPPWLFLEKSKWPHPHPDEKRTLLELEERLAKSSSQQMHRELQAAGLWSIENHEAKYRALLDGSPALAEVYATFLMDQRALGLEKSPWLFRARKSHAEVLNTSVGSWSLPHVAEKLMLAELEREANAIEGAEQALGGDPEPPQLLQRRSRLLRRLAEVGLLENGLHSKKKHWLQEWSLSSLVMIYDTALQALTYLESEERRRYNPNADETEILAAPLCLDAFRGMPTPKNVTLHSWISWGEYLFRTYGPKQDVPTDQGEFPYSDQDGLIIVVWRKDAGFPALRYLSLRRPDEIG